MSTAVLAARSCATAYRAEDEAITRAQAVLARAEIDHGWWPNARHARDRILAVIAGLRDCLAGHAALLDGTDHPASVFQDLGRHQDDALAIALERVTEDITAWTADLVLTVREQAGDWAADYVNGITEGEQAA